MKKLDLKKKTGTILLATTVAGGLIIPGAVFAATNNTKDSMKERPTIQIQANTQNGELSSENQFDGEKPTGEMPELPNGEQPTGEMPELSNAEQQNNQEQNFFQMLQKLPQDFVNWLKGVFGGNR